MKTLQKTENCILVDVDENRNKINAKVYAELLFQIHLKFTFHIFYRSSQFLGTRSILFKTVFNREKHLKLSNTENIIFLITRR